MKLCKAPEKQVRVMFSRRPSDFAGSWPPCSGTMTDEVRRLRGRGPDSVRPPDRENEAEHAESAGTCTLKKWKIRFHRQGESMTKKAEGDQLQMCGNYVLRRRLQLLRLRNGPGRGRNAPLHSGQLPRLSLFPVRGRVPDWP